MATSLNNASKVTKIGNKDKVESKDEKNIKDVSDSKALLVVAIDFGTTYTGYAYSFRHDYHAIFTSRFSRGESRTPTVVLLTPDEKFLAFGHEAEEKYVELLDEDKAYNYFYFERFKMKLYETKKLHRDTTIKDKTGKQMLAIDVFAMVIEYLKRKVEQDITKACAGLDVDNDIEWVITVPAIWSDGAKQFMREAANKAGIMDSNLKLVLEPEAASLYCKSQKTCKTAKLDGSVMLEHFPEGHKYIVADLGGGTADLSVHEILQDGNLKEIRRADGDAYGGILVDMAFTNFLATIFGQNVLKEINKHHSYLVIELQNTFDRKKRKFGTEEKYRVTIPNELNEIIKSVDGVTLADKKRQATDLHKGKVTFTRKIMEISPEIMESFFSEAVDGIVKHIQKMREDDELREINTLLMVGGFSESEYVQNQIKVKVPGMRIIVPMEPSMSVLKGAVIMGHKPNIITQRIARFTYGFSNAKIFEEGVHPEELKVKQGDKELCRSIFGKMIESGQVLEYGDTFSCTSVWECTKPEDQFHLPTTDLYRSTHSNPLYATEDYGCELVGMVVMFPPRPRGWPPITMFVQALVVQESEMTVIAHNVNTGEIIGGKLDFL